MLWIKIIIEPAIANFAVSHYCLHRVRSGANEDISRQAQATKVIQDQIQIPCWPVPIILLSNYDSRLNIILVELILLIKSPFSLMLSILCGETSSSSDV